MQSTPILARRAFTLLALALWFAPAPAKELANANPAPIPIAVSVPALQTFANRIGGRYARAETLVPPGRALDNVGPNAALAALGAAQLFIHGGSAAEASWLARLRAAHPGLRIVNLAAGLATSDRTSAPYPWTSPPLAKRLIWGIRDALIALDPSHAEVYRERTATLAGDINALDGALRATLSPVRHRRFLAFDPVWGHFARAYGLTQIPLPEPDKQTPGQAGLPTTLIDLALQEGIRAVFAPPRGDSSDAADLAKAIGGQAARLDPLAPDYFETMRQAATLIADADLK